LEWDIAAGNFFDWAKKKSEITLPLSQIQLPDADEDSSGPDAEPIQLGGVGNFAYHLRLEFPAKYAVRAPLPFSMKRDYGQYEANYKVEGLVFTADRKLTVNTNELPAERVHDYLAFRRAVTADTAQRVSVDSTAAGAPTAPADLKGDDLNDAANAALDRGNYQIAIDLFKRVVEAEPKHKTAWMNLGRAYMGLRQTEPAIAAFRKQTELNEYDEYGYNNLGWAYRMARRYDEAAVAFTKALEINPLNEYAHSALGAMYAEEHQYDKAAPELEKAVSLKPDNAFLQISLGDAYLNLGQDEKALAAFDRAVEIQPIPEVWNNIAYQLSLKQAHLDRAQQYAESAVIAVAAGLRNMSLDQLTERHLQLVSSLAADWDTLGWVHFAEGDFGKAEKYVTSGWMLGQNGEEGDHLGQLYEKLGRKQDAIRMYAMTLSGLRPPLETRGRLAALLGGDDKVAGVSAKYRDDLQATRTIPLGKVAKETGSAEFFVILAPGSPGISVAGVKFVSGDEKLKVFTETLRNAKYDFSFPDDTPTKVLRRGILSCSKITGDCVFVMMLPEDVRSVR
jgi:tetratricopeptide (TPR) repeat protein